MKFKFPKKIVIGDTTFHIKYDKKSSGADFVYPGSGKRALITLGTIELKSNPVHILNIFMHEVKEIIQVEQSVRYKRPDNGEYEFHYTHREHTDLVSRMAAAVDQFIK